MRKRKRTKRANGEGGITALKNGRFRVDVTIGRCPEGRQLRRSVTVDTRADANAERRRLVAEKDQGKLVARTQRRTIAELMKKWLDDVVTPNLEPTTEASYRHHAESYVVPRLGHVDASKLSVVAVEEFLAKLSDDGVGSRTRQMSYEMLSRAMRKAVAWGFAASNPCREVPKPKGKLPDEDIDAFDSAELAAVLKTAAGTRYEAYFVTAAGTGMRPGELLGLTWQCVDFQAGTIRVKQQLRESKGAVSVVKPKTARSNRTIDMPVRVAEALAAHRERAAAWTKGKSKVRRDTPEQFVFLGYHGGPLRKSNLRNRHWHPLQDDAGVRRRTLHQLRHTYATLALGARVPVHVVSAVLGHANPGFTLRVYSHALKGQQHEAREAMDRVLLACS